jgi:hypothetical protein
MIKLRCRLRANQIKDLILISPVPTSIQAVRVPHLRGTVPRWLSFVTAPPPLLTRHRRCLLSSCWSRKLKCETITCHDITSKSVKISYCSWEDCSALEVGEACKVSKKGVLLSVLWNNMSSIWFNYRRKATPMQGPMDITAPSLLICGILQ